MKNLTEYTQSELLKVFNDKFLEYENNRDEELAFLSDHPNRDFWADEQVEEYNEILRDIDRSYVEIHKISDFIRGLR